MPPSGQGGRGAPLPESFYRRPTPEVARALLGCRLVHRLADGSERRLVIVETEAYLGVVDRAAHTWNGRRTARVAPMWGPGGHAYVYAIYGLHVCMNVVTQEAGTPEAVLLRAGISEAWWRGERVSREEARAAAGPGLFCRFLGVTKSQSGASLEGPELLLVPPLPRVFETVSGPRVGVDYAGEAAGWELRFAVAGCPAVTRPRGLRPPGTRPRRDPAAARRRR